MRAVRTWARTVRNDAVASQTRWLELEAGAIAKAALPGQFAMLGYGLADLAAPFIPRPFSIAFSDRSDRIGFLVREFGAGSRRLAASPVGERILVLGPLGRPFTVPERTPVVCLAGGVGLAPFLFVGSEARRARRAIRLVYGERSADRVFDPSLIRELTGIEPELRTEDGTLGEQGRVIDHLVLEDGTVLLACGPHAMLRACRALAKDAGHALQVSVEEHMGCGFGTCQGCVVRASSGEWIRSCTDGPVFDAEELAWET